MRLVADAQGVRNGDLDLGAAVLDADTRVVGLHCLDLRLHRCEHLGLRRGTDRNDVELGQIAIGFRLADLDARACAAVVSKVRVAGSGRRFPIPDDVQLRVDAFERVRDERVAVVLEPSVLDERRQLLRESWSVGHAAEFRLGNPGRPSLRSEHFDVGAVVDRTVREERPLDEIDEVGSDIARRLALLVGIEEPRRPDIGRT